MGGATFLGRNRPSDFGGGLLTNRFWRTDKKRRELIIPSPYSTRFASRCTGETESIVDVVYCLVLSAGL
jgi:hypothetical protein